MSITEQIDLARSKTNWATLDRLLDDQRRAFLDRLHVAAQDAEIKRDGITVIKPARVRLTEWEQRFVTDHVTEQRPFTDPIRAAIDEMRKRYERQLC